MRHPAAKCSDSSSLVTTAQHFAQHSGSLSSGVPQRDIQELSQTPFAAPWSDIARVKSCRTVVISSSLQTFGGEFYFGFSARYATGGGGSALGGGVQTAKGGVLCAAIQRISVSAHSRGWSPEYEHQANDGQNPLCFGSSAQGRAVASGSACCHRAAAGISFSHDPRLITVSDTKRSFRVVCVPPPPPSTRHSTPPFQAIDRGSGHEPT